MVFFLCGAINDYNGASLTVATIVTAMSTVSKHPYINRNGGPRNDCNDESDCHVALLSSIEFQFSYFMSTISVDKTINKENGYGNQQKTK